MTVTVTSRPMAATSDQRRPWHYDVFEGRPEWSKEMAREYVIRRQQQNLSERRSRRKPRE